MTNTRDKGQKITVTLWDGETLVFFYPETSVGVRESGVLEISENKDNPKVRCLAPHAWDEVCSEPVE